MLKSADAIDVLADSFIMRRVPWRIRSDNRPEFVTTGVPQDGPIWKALRRVPLSLGTSIPGVFAIRDVRASSTRRVTAAVGEGAAVVVQLHTILGADQATGHRAAQPSKQLSLT